MHLFEEKVSKHLSSFNLEIMTKFTFILLSNLSHTDSFWEGIHLITSEEHPIVWAFSFS